MKAKYDQIGKSYSNKRKSDPRIARALNQKLKGASKVLNIGAGTGSYESKDIDLIAVEPSKEMILQRANDAHPVVQSYAEELPFADNTFSHTISILSMHHWTDRKKAFEEINRVTREKFVAITWNPNSNPFWLTKDYFPEIYQKDLTIFPPIEEFKDSFINVQFEPLLIPQDCQDGFLAAFWKRPKAYLENDVRNSISTFSKLPNLNDGLKKLENDINNGIWESKNKFLLDKEFIDVGYIILTAEIN